MVDIDSDSSHAWGFLNAGVAGWKTPCCGHRKKHATLRLAWLSWSKKVKRTTLKNARTGYGLPSKEAFYWTLSDWNEMKSESNIGDLRFRFNVLQLCQEVQLLTLEEYIAGHVKTKRTFKNEKQRREFLTKDLGLKLQKDPKRNCLCVGVAGKTTMVTGTRLSTSRVKSQNFQDDKEGAKEAFVKAREGLAESVQVNTEATSNVGMKRVFRQFF